VHRHCVMRQAGSIALQCANVGTTERRLALRSDRLFEGLPQVGGHPALDLVNTVEYRGRSDPRDHLKSLDQLLAWCELSSLIDAGESRVLRELADRSPVACERMLNEVSQLREAARKALGSKLKGAADASAAEFLRKRVERAARSVVVTLDGSGTSFKREHPIGALGSLVDRIALSIEDAFTIAARQSLRECEGANCDWLFFDHSRSGRRRWCHPGECGNAERVRRFRARQAAHSFR